MRHLIAIILFMFDARFRRLFLAKLAQHGPNETVGTGETVVPVLRQEIDE